MDHLTQYRSNILEAYARALNGPHAHYLAQPGQAGLRELCIEICLEGNRLDLAIFKAFTGMEFDASQKQKIRDHTDKFKPIVAFFKGERTLAKAQAADMAALLVGYGPRPFRAFREACVSGLVAEPDFVYSVNTPETSHAETQEEKTPSPNAAHDQSYTQPPAVRPGKVRKVLLALGSAIAGVAAFFLLTAPPPGDCMQWQGDRYVAVPCSGDRSDSVVLAKDTAQFGMRKVTVTRNTRFFRDGQPILWYLKDGNAYEFFDRPGHHPEKIDRELKPVSTIIAKKALARISP